MAAPREGLGRSHGFIRTWYIQLCKVHCSAGEGLVSRVSQEEDKNDCAGDTGEKSRLGQQSCAENKKRKV